VFLLFVSCYKIIKLKSKYNSELNGGNEFELKFLIKHQFIAIRRIYLPTTNGYYICEIFSWNNLESIPRVCRRIY